MRYLDTGSRDPRQALGSWLVQVLDPAVVTEVRVQSGFFGSTGLGLFVPVFESLAATRGPVNFLVGSNDGQTASVDLTVLLEVLGAPRPNLNVGVVKFANGYFHPKAIHLKRADGTAAAYTGSANLTHSGVSSLHVEAGIALDTADGDDPTVVDEMAGAIDAWFATSPPGLYRIASVADLGTLSDAGIIDRRPPAPPRPPRLLVDASGQTSAEPAVKPLVNVPGIKLAKGSPVRAKPVVPPRSPRPSSAPVDVTYAKKITPSDAQRKNKGNQRGAITLTRGRKGDTQTYFRFDLFAGAHWQTEKTNTGEVMEVAYLPMLVTYFGQVKGRMHMKLTYAENRQEDQKNYTTLLHVGRLKDDVDAQDPTDRELTIQRHTDGSFDLTIG